MDRPDKRTSRTAKALLTSAAEVFARKGYRDATIAEICEGADANIAAVNYYFRSKENLYVEAWRQGFERVSVAHPADGGVNATAPAAQRLRGRIVALMNRFRDPENHIFDIVHQELQSPTGLLDEAIRRCIAPVHQALFELVAELLGPAASDGQVFLCTRSVMAQCLHLLIPERRQRGVSKALSQLGCFPSRSSTDELADHVTRFSLAGIRQLRCEIEDATTDESESSRE